MAASGAQEQLESNPGYYQSLLGAEHDATLRDTIQAGEAAETGLGSGEGQRSAVVVGTSAVQKTL